MLSCPKYCPKSEISLTVTYSRTDGACCSDGNERVSPPATQRKVSILKNL